MLRPSSVALTASTTTGRLSRRWSAATSRAVTYAARPVSKDRGIPALSIAASTTSTRSQTASRFPAMARARVDLPVPGSPENTTRRGPKKRTCPQNKPGAVRPHQHYPLWDSDRPCLRTGDRSIPTLLRAPQGTFGIIPLAEKAHVTGSLSKNI
jgi:hypothetical protein